jgi:AcrR family transcriptional regulator
MPRREEAKDERRQRITQAARDLIRSTAQTGFSMRQLAVHANVSLVTPYNLFGSKQAILQTVLDADVDAFGEELSHSNKDPLDRFFEAISLGRDYFARDEDYYRTVMNTIYTEGAQDFRAAYRAPRRAFWRSLVDDAMHCGVIHPSPHAEALSIHLASVYFINILEWIHGEISLDLMEARTVYGFALALTAHTPAIHHPRLQELVEAALEDIDRLTAADADRAGDPPAGQLSR